MFGRRRAAHQAPSLPGIDAAEFEARQQQALKTLADRQKDISLLTNIGRGRSLDTAPYLIRGAAHTIMPKLVERGGFTEKIDVIGLRVSGNYTGRTSSGIELLTARHFASAIQGMPQTGSIDFCGEKKALGPQILPLDVAEIAAEREDRSIVFVISSQALRHFGITDPSKVSGGTAIVPETTTDGQIHWTPFAGSFGRA